MQENPYAPAPRPVLGFDAVPDLLATQAAASATGPSVDHGRLAPAARLRLGIRPCTTLAGLGITRRNPVLGDWFMEGDLGFVFAPRGLGKTWLSLALACAIAAGEACGPWQAAPSPRRVLYVDGEMPCESLAARIAGMGGTAALSVLNHEALFHQGGGVLNFADPATQDALTSLMLADGVEVVFLDNLSCLFSGVSENDADAWESVLRWLLELRRHRIAVVVIHHSGRNKEMRGTSRREDAAFWVIRLEPAGAEGRDGARFISRFTKDRNSRLEQPATEWNFLTGADGRVATHTQPAESLDVFRQWIADGLTGAEDIAQEMGVSKGTVAKLAKRAMEAGWLRKEGREYALAD